MIITNTNSPISQPHCEFSLLLDARKNLTNDQDIHGLWLAFANDNGDMEYALHEESTPTRSNLLSVLKFSSFLKPTPILQNISYISAFKDILGFATWKPCKKRKKIILVKNTTIPHVTPPCLSIQGKCAHCKSKSLDSGFKMSNHLSLFHRQCLHLLAGEQNSKGEFVSIKYT